MSSTTAAALPTQQQSASTQMEHDEKIPAAVSSQDTEEYVSEDEEQHQDFSNVAGSQSCLSQELQVAAFSQDSSAVAMTSTDFTPSILLEEKTANNSNNKSSSADSLTTNNTPAAAAAEARSENAPSALEPTASSTASAKENNSYNDNMKQEPKKPESKNNEETHEFLEFAKAAKRKAGKNPKTPKIKTTSPNESSQASVKDFGTLLSAVEIFTSQEDGDDYKFSQEETLQNDPILQQANNSDNGIQEDSQEGVRQLLQSSSDQSDAEAEAKKEQPQPELSKKRKRKGDNEKSRQQVNAQRAADLAKRTITDPDLAKRLLLSMALTRENPRSPPAELPGKGHMLISGFFWAKYPPLEKILKDNMAEYYELSITKCQSAQQQDFNNRLVQLVRSEVSQREWIFEKCFTDKCLRDRIRCYYKTHIQNAKKRLRTMIKNPTKRANARHLCAHLDIIENTANFNSSNKKQCEDSPQQAAHPQAQPQPQAHPHAHAHALAYPPPPPPSGAAGYYPPPPPPGYYYPPPPYAYHPHYLTAGPGPASSSASNTASAPAPTSSSPAQPSVPTNTNNTAGVPVPAPTSNTQQQTQTTAPVSNPAVPTAPTNKAQPPQPRTASTQPPQAQSQPQAHSTREPQASTSRQAPVEHQPPSNNKFPAAASLASKPAARVSISS